MSIFKTSTDRSLSAGEKYSLREKLFGSTDLLPMWVADMDIDTPRFITDALQERSRFRNYGYEMISDEMWDEQIAWVKRRHGVQLEREWAFYSHSVVASMSVAILAFTNLDDEVVVQTPIYPPFISTVNKCGRRVVTNPLKIDESGEWCFDLDDLRSKITQKTKLLLLCSPHNPVGRVWREDELKSLSDICLEHNILIFSDEIHSDLVYKPHKHTPLISISKDVKNSTITAVGPGKSFNIASLCISSAFIASEQMRQKFSAVYETMHFSQGNTFAHIGFTQAYRHGDEWLDQLLAHLQTNHARLQKTLDRYGNIKLNSLEGTYLAWLDCKELGFGSDRKLREFFIKKAKLGLSPGISFGVNGSGYMRLNFAVSEEIMSDALSRLDGALKSL